MAFEVKDGDYAIGSSLMNLIWRRLVTPKGGFAHLPEFGLGIQPKRLATDSKLKELRAAIEKAAMKDYRVKRAFAKIVKSGSILAVYLTVQLKDGGQEQYNWEVNNG